MPPPDEAKEELERLWQAIAFRTAVDAGQTEKVDEMIAEGMNPNQKMTDGSHWTVLMLAANAGQTELVSKFTGKAGRMPRIDEDDPHGFQAIHLASMNGNFDICKILLEKKADANAKIKQGETPLMMASAKGHASCVQLLLDNGADPDAEDKNGMSAVKKASRWGHTECVKALLPKIKEDARQKKHCLLFAKLYEHEELRLLLDPPPEEGAEAAELADAEPKEEEVAVA